MAAIMNRCSSRSKPFVIRPHQPFVLLGCRVSEIAVIRWKDIEALDDGRSDSQGIRQRISDELFAYRQRHAPPLCKALAAALMKSSSESLVPRGMGISHAKRLEMFAVPGACGSRRVRPPTPAEAQPWTPRCAELSWVLKPSVPNHARTFVERDNWSLRSCGPRKTGS